MLLFYQKGMGRSFIMLLFAHWYQLWIGFAICYVLCTENVINVLQIFQIKYICKYILFKVTQTHRTNVVYLLCRVVKFC